MGRNSLRGCCGALELAGLLKGPAAELPHLARLQDAVQEHLPPPAPRTPLRSTVEPQAGSYEFEPTVEDANGVTARRSIPLAAGPSGTTALLVSLAPGGEVVLGAGLPPPVLSLVATPSSAQPGLEYAWSQVRGPPVVLGETAPGTAGFTPVTPGIYEFALRVFDGHACTPTARTTWRVR
jgi:hypothetical protein